MEFISSLIDLEDHPTKKVLRRVLVDGREVPFKVLEDGTVIFDPALSNRPSAGG